MNHESFFRAVLRFQTLLPGFDSEMHDFSLQVTHSFPLFTTRVTSYVNSLPSLPLAREFIASIKPLFNTESQGARRSLFMPVEPGGH